VAGGVRAARLHATPISCIPQYRDITIFGKNEFRNKFRSVPISLHPPDRLLHSNSGSKIFFNVYDNIWQNMHFWKVFFWLILEGNLTLNRMVQVVLSCDLYFFRYLRFLETTFFFQNCRFWQKFMFLFTKKRYFWIVYEFQILAFCSSIYFLTVLRSNFWYAFYFFRKWNSNFSKKFNFEIMKNSLYKWFRNFKLENLVAHSTWFLDWNLFFDRFSSCIENEIPNLTKMTVGQNMQILPKIYFFVFKKRAFTDGLRISNSHIS